MTGTPFRTTVSLPPLRVATTTPTDSGTPPAAPLPPELAARLCAADRPLALFPVRLETRFFNQADGSRELRVRVYPDKIHLDSHEPDLLAEEADWGRHFWTEDWRAGDDEAGRQAAWRQLADRFGAARAAFVARQLHPTNAAERPTSPAPTDQPPAPAPVFPQPPLADATDTSSWRRAPQARLLPERWTAVLLSDGEVLAAVQGAPIAAPLAVGPDPQGTPDSTGDGAPVDEGMRWMVDFAAAEAAGMALRVALPPAAAEGADSLIVFGTGTLAPDVAAAGLANLLDAHHYTDDLEILRPGVPTNNTAEERSGFGAPDPAHTRSFAREIAADPAGSGPDANARTLGAALGLPGSVVPAVLGRVAGAADTQDRDAHSLNAALWPTSWGYLVEGILGLGEAGLTADIAERARAHFLDHVRAFGPLPPLRLGRQPYGVLPVTSLDLMEAQPDDPLVPKLRDLLVTLRDKLWRPHLGRVPRIGARTGPPDPDADLADVMRSEALSRGLSVRAALGRHYLSHLRAFLGEDLQASGFLAAQNLIAGALPQRLGLTAGRLAELAFADLAWPVTAPWVQTGTGGPDATLEPDYIRALLDAPTIAAVVAQEPADPQETTVLQTLLRHALLREIANAAARIVATDSGADLAGLLREPELIDLVTGAPPVATWQSRLDSVAASVTGQQTIRAYIESRSVFDTPELAQLGELRDSLAHLDSLDAGRLELNVRSGLDIATHRLDAWITSLATARLKALRAEKPEGLYVGGYGWVENLRPGPTPKPVATPPEGLDGPLVFEPADSGFIHAPSLTHASAAALLRNAHLGASNTPEADSPFAIRLTSRRVREAEALLSGMRQGQPLGALLGYRIERNLHQLGLDAYIGPLREIAPLAGSGSGASGQPQEAIAAVNVVDGLALEAKWRGAPGPIRSRLQQVGTAADKVAVELDRLQDTLDGLADALVAETAYQIARGNPTRLASGLAALSQGDAAPPEARGCPHPAQRHRADPPGAGADPAGRHRVRLGGP